MQWLLQYNALGAAVQGLNPWMPEALSEAKVWHLRQLTTNYEGCNARGQNYADYLYLCVQIGTLSEQRRPLIPIVMSMDVIR